MIRTFASTARRVTLHARCSQALVTAFSVVNTNHSFNARYPVLDLSNSVAKMSSSSLPRPAFDAADPSSCRIGFIGTGVMGSSMCGHLMAAGYKASVFNRTASKCGPLVEKGAKLCSTPKEVAENSDVVFSIVGYPADVRSVILDKDTGALAGLRPGCVVIEMTTSEPSLAEEIAKEAAAKGVHSIDAPVSGGDVGARNATLSVMCGADDASVFEHVKPLLEKMGKNVRLMGKSGKGQHTKAINQILIANNMVGVCEGLLYAHKAGMDPLEVIAAVGAGAAGSFSINVLGPRISKRDFAPGFYVEHFIKDLGICLGEAKRMKIALPGLALANQLYVALEAQGHGRSGTQALITALERLNGVDSASVKPVFPPSEPPK